MPLHILYCCAFIFLYTFKQNEGVDIVVEWSGSVGIVAS